MSEIDPETLLENATLIGLIERHQAADARADAADGSLDAIVRSLSRKGLLTSWQLERLKKNEHDGFFFGGCKVLFHIAEGTFARVYRGRRYPGNQSVAIKVLRQRFVADADSIQRFNQEAEAGLKLIHPNIVRIYEYGDQNNRHFMIMEYVEGSNLRDFLKIRARIAASDALPLMVGLARGLQYSLNHGVTHRDIKATNILIASNGEAKLVDFGLATIEGEDRKMAAAHGQRTVDYSALERTCNSPKGDHRSDIFFLGCVFYQMLTGQLPLPEVESKDPLAKMLKRSFGAIKPLSEQRHAPDPRLSAIIEKMMKMDLKARYQNMDAVVADIDAFLASEAEAQVAAAAPPATAPDRPPMAPAESFDPDAGFDGDIFEAGAFEVAAVAPKRLLCVEFQPMIQEAFRKTLAGMGYRVLLVGHIEFALERFREKAPDALVFDCDGFGPEAIDVLLEIHDLAREEGRELAGLVLLGPRQHSLASRIPTDGRLVVLTKPIKMKQVQDAVARLAPARA